MNGEIGTGTQEGKDKKMAKEIYVIVADEGGCDNGPIVMETDVNVSSKKNAISRVDRLKETYGKCRLAKLEFVNVKHYGFRKHKED